MNEALLDFICCPVCKGPIELIVHKKKAKEILEGTLTCLNCDIHYTIRKGIPNLLPPD